MLEFIEHQMLTRFFLEEHLIVKKQDGEEKMKFLKPPSWHGGGRVPKSALYRKDNIFLMRIEMIPAVDIIYAALGTVNSLAKTKYDEDVGIRLIPKVLHACERRGIPQNFAPGILLLYLEHCEGCQWRHLVAPMLQEKQGALNCIDKMRSKALKMRSDGLERHDFNLVDLAKEYEDAAKLGSEDWLPYMIEGVADFLKEMRHYR